jgi:hypothetical protein
MSAPLELEELVLRVGASSWDAWVDPTPAPAEPRWVAQRREPEGDRGGPRTTLRGLSLEVLLVVVLNSERCRYPGPIEVEVEVGGPWTFGPTRSPCSP